MIRRTQVGHVLHPGATGAVYLAFVETPRGSLTLTATSLFRLRAELRGRITSERARLLRPSVVADIVRPSAEQLQVLSRAHTLYYHLRLRTVVSDKVRVVWDATGSPPPGFLSTERTPSLLLGGKGKTVLELPDLRRVMWVGDRPFLEVFDGTDVGYSPAPQHAGAPEAPVAKADLAVFASTPDDVLPLESRASHLHPRFSKELPLYYLRTRETLPEVDGEFETLVARAARPAEAPIPAEAAHPGLREALDFFSQRKPSG